MASNNRERKTPYPGFTEEQWATILEGAEQLQMKPVVFLRAAAAAFLLENTNLKLEGIIY